MQLFALKFATLYAEYLKRKQISNIKYNLFNMSRRCTIAICLALIQLTAANHLRVSKQSVDPKLALKFTSQQKINFLASDENSKDSHVKVKRLENVLLKKNRVLLVTHNLVLQGAPLFMFRLLAGLHEYGWKHVDVLSPSSGPLKAFIEERGAKVHVAGDIQSWLHQNGALYDIIHYNTIVMCHAHLHKDLQACNTDCSGLPSLAFWTIHESYPSFFTSNCPRLTDDFKHARRVFFVSKGTHRLYVDEKFVSPLKSSVIYNGLNVSEYDGLMDNNSVSKARQKLEILQRAFVIVSIGTVEKRKGQLELSQAFIEVLRMYNLNASRANARPLHLYIVGVRSDDETLQKYSENVRMVANNPRASGRIHLIDHTDQNTVRLYMRSADVHVLHGYNESMPYSIMESMAMGVPQVLFFFFRVMSLLFQFKSNCVDSQVSHFLISSGIIQLVWYS